MTMKFSSDLLEPFFVLAEKTIHTHPLLVLWCFYDLTMTVRPNYPKEKTCGEVAADLTFKAEQYIALLQSGVTLFPGVEMDFSAFRQADRDVKDETGQMYGRQWKKFDIERQLEFARKAVEHRIGLNGFSLDQLKGKRVIDMGCGSGRYACALASFGPAEVVGVDWGDDGLEVAREMASVMGLKNIRFQKASIIDLPFEDDSFDFCYANGVFHHTQDMWKGVSEQYRIMKKGGAGWLYLYGTGGFFWNSRLRMREILKSVPELYTESFLRLVSHDRNWFVPMDVWYVPIELHTSAADLEARLRDMGYASFERTRHGLPGDRNLEFLEADPLAPVIYGEGDLRYILHK
ncbi:MAG: class I SAM-dependent methyltransferase [Desulfovibrionaceae bacterium]